jgi:flavin-binding protein dodecin
MTPAALHDVLIAHELATVDPGEAMLIGCLAVGERALPAMTNQQGERLVGGGRRLRWRRHRHRRQQDRSARHPLLRHRVHDHSLVVAHFHGRGPAWPPGSRRVAITQGRQHHACTRTTNRRPPPAGLEGEKSMADSVYKIIELVGTSTESWEKAAGAAVTQAAKTLRDLRIVEVAQLDMQVQNGKVKTYRAKVKVSFKFEGKK